MRPGEAPDSVNAERRLAYPKAGTLGNYPLFAEWDVWRRGRCCFSWSTEYARVEGAGSRLPSHFLSAEFASFPLLSHPHGVFSPGGPGSTLDPHTIVERGGTGVGVTSPPG